MAVVTTAVRQKTVMRQERLESGFVGFNGELQLAGAPPCAAMATASGRVGGGCHDTRAPFGFSRNAFPDLITILRRHRTPLAATGKVPTRSLALGRNLNLRIWLPTIIK
jgi:hypothetical protein